MSTDIRLTRSAAPYGTITITGAKTIAGRFSGFFVTTALTGVVILGKDNQYIETDITSDIIEAGAVLEAGAFHTPPAGIVISSLTITGGTATIVRHDNQ